MNNKLTQEYKDDLYGKVLEKKRIRNIKRKKMLSVFIVFISVVGFTTLGFSLLEKEDYKNFFISETENITFNDEYEYFDDLGIKLEFINIDKNSLTLGINIKYENIADYKFKLEEVKVLEKNNKILLKENYRDLNDKINFTEMKKDIKLINYNEMLYIIKYECINKIHCNAFNVVINNLILKENEKKEFEYIKEISIGE